MKFVATIKLLVAILIFSSNRLAAQGDFNNHALFIRAGKLFDSENEKLLINQVVKVEKNLVTEVGSNIKIPNNAKVIDLSDYTVLPGLIDAHTHLLYSESPHGDLTSDGLKAIIQEGDGLRVLRGASRAKTFLEAGITTVRDLGNSGQFLDVALKKAIDEGSVPGCRMIVSGPILCSEGGQMAGMIKSHSHLIDLEYRVIRSVDDAIAAVRENINYGADVIKICANNTPNNTSLTLEEMKAIVKTAHRYNKQVSAHATNNRAVWEAVVAGVDCIEHGRQVADTTLQLMATKGIRLVPTDAHGKILSTYLDIIRFTGDKESRVKNYRRRCTDKLQRAIKAGVEIISGSDAYLDMNMPQGELAKNNLIAYYESGMEPFQILKSATYNSARFLGLEHKIGVIKINGYADIIAVRGDIEKNFKEAIFDIVFVMKNGIVYVEKY